jgi:hypothetical protein
LHPQREFWQTSDIKFGNSDHYPYRHHWQLFYIIIPFKVAFNLMMLEFCVKFTIGVNEFFVSMLKTWQEDKKSMFNYSPDALIQTFNCALVKSKSGRTMNKPKPSEMDTVYVPKIKRKN